MSEKKKKVLLATHLAPIIHGQALMSHQLAAAQEPWDDLKIISLNTAYAETREGLKGGAIKKLSKLWSYLKQAEELIKKESIDTLIVTPAFFRAPFFKDQFFLRYLKKRTGVRVIGWVHMDPARLELAKLPAPLQKLAKRLVKNVDQWVCCADALGEQWPDWLTETKEKPHPIFNGIPDPSIESASGSNQRRHLMYLSSMDPEKGWRDLFEVGQQLAAERDDFEIHFYGGVGAGETEEGIRTVFATSGFSDRIQWHGETWDAAKAEAFAKSDLFVFPSHTEQFPISILEAMAHGLPIVATDVGAIRDALPEQALLHPQQPQALRQSLIEFLDQPDQYLAQSERNRQRFSDLFSQEAFLNSWHDFLTQIPTKSKL